MVGMDELSLSLQLNVPTGDPVGVDVPFTVTEVWIRWTYERSE